MHLGAGKGATREMQNGIYFRKGRYAIYTLGFETALFTGGKFEREDFAFLPR